MASAKVYSGINLRGQRLTGLPAPQEPGDAVPQGHLPIAVGPVDTAATNVPHLFVQTGLGADSTGITMWIEDGR